MADKVSNMIPHINIGRLQIIWWPRRCLFRVWVWPDYPPELGVLPMFRSVILWPLEFRWWFNPTRESIEAFISGGNEA